MGSENSDATRCLEGHLGVQRTRAEILERFYWKNAGQDFREFVLACDNCQKVNPVQKSAVGELLQSDVGELHPTCASAKRSDGPNYWN